MDSISSTQTLYIEVKSADGGESLFHFQAVGVVVVGRSANTSNLVLDDQRVSRVHLQLEVEPDGFITVTDLNSANGSRLDGTPLAPGIPSLWLPNQRLELGNSTLLLREKDPPVQLEDTPALE